MRISTRLGGLALAAVTTVSLVNIASADAARAILYLGASGGTKVTAANGVVTSGVTAESYVQGITFPSSDSNEIADARLNGLISTGVVDTSESAVRTSTGAELTSRARTAGTKILGGLIKVGVLDTISTATIDGSTVDGTSTTDLTQVKITNVDLPVSIPKNFTVDIPGVARVVLNFSTTYKAPGTVSTIGAGVYVTLLQASGGFDSGTQLLVNPTYSAMTTHIPHTPVLLGGTTYGTQLTAGVSGVGGITSGMTARQDLPSAGTDGRAITNSTAGVDVPGILHTGAILTTIRGTAKLKAGDARTTAKVARISLLGGVIRAKAITSAADVHADSSRTLTITDSSRLLGLKIAGQSYPVKVAPNTVVDVAGLGTVTLNEQVKAGFYTQVRAVVVTLSTARAGLPAGAVIEIGVSSAYVLD